jgi:hypothetical protein
LLVVPIILVTIELAFPQTGALALPFAQEILEFVSNESVKAGIPPEDDVEPIVLKLPSISFRRFGTVLSDGSPVDVAQERRHYLKQRSLKELAGEIIISMNPIAF